MFVFLLLFFFVFFLSLEKFFLVFFFFSFVLCLFEDFPVVFCVFCGKIGSCFSLVSCSYFFLWKKYRCLLCFDLLRLFFGENVKK